MSFGKEKETTTDFPSGQASLKAFLGEGSKVVGTLTFSGAVQLDGTVEGEIKSEEKLTIGEKAIINAKVSGVEVIVKGTVNGDIFASKKLSLLKPAKVIGNISSTNLSIQEGVVFDGQCNMSHSSTIKEATPSKVTTIK